MDIPLLAMPMMTSQSLKSVDFTKAQKSRYFENKILFFLQIRKMGVSKQCTHLHPAYFSLNPALCSTLNVIRTKILHVIGQFSQHQFLGKFGSKKSNLSVLSENWNTSYLEDADSYSDIIFLNFQS